MGTGKEFHADNDNEKYCKYVCRTINQPNTKTNLNLNPNLNPITEQHAKESIH